MTDTDHHSVLTYHLTAVQETTVTHASVQRRIYRNALVRRSGALCRAYVVVSMDGSHLDHAHLSLRPGSVMVVLTGSREQGCVVDVNKVLRTVDLAEARAQR